MKSILMFVNKELNRIKKNEAIFNLAKQILKEKI